MLLVTGATGFLGGALVAEIFATRAAFRPVLLVRGPDSMARLRASLGLYLGAPAAAQALSECVFWEADLGSLDRVPPAAWSEITHVIHAAANTSFRSRTDVYRTNVEGTLALSGRLQHASRLVRFLHVSTAYQCGADSEPAVAETDAPGTAASHLVAYTRSKAQAEAALRAHAGRLPLVIARPSIIVGHSTLGCRPSASIFWYYRALAALNFAPFSPERRRDIVPVDHVARALLFLLTRPALAHSLYHVSAGAQGSARWSELAGALAGLYGFSHAAPPDLADSELIAARRHDVLRACAAPDDGRLLEALESVFAFSRYRAAVFENGRLSDEGFPPPPPFLSYVERCATQPAGRTIYEQMHDDAG
jgi:nucleoside-diphosphate-sugar epimerase